MCDASEVIYYVGVCDAHYVLGAAIDILYICRSNY